MDNTNFNISTIIHDNVQNIYVQSKNILLKEKKLTIDFNQTTKFDSSIFALLLGLRRIANKYQYPLQVSLSPALKTLADVYGIYDIL